MRSFCKKINKSNKLIPKGIKLISTKSVANSNNLNLIEENVMGEKESPTPLKRQKNIYEENDDYFKNTENSPSRDSQNDVNCKLKLADFLP